MRELPDNFPYSYIPIICGPTASGKSSLALEICRLANNGGELISCDSMQIYKGLDAGTAKATREEQSEIKHHLIDIIDPGTNFSVNDFLEYALESIQDVLNRNKLPVLCGGTGQYISALRDGISYEDKIIPDELINEMFALYEKNKNVDSYYEELVKIDPEAAEKIHPNNIRRVIRALAVFKATGKTFTQWNKESKKSGPLFPFKLFELNYEENRELLYQRINSRVDIMMDEGLLKEAQDLYALDVDKKSTCFQAIGYKEFKQYFDGDISLEKAIYDIKLNSRHYAKRQLTWFRYMEDIYKLNYLTDNDTNARTVLKEIL